MVWSSSALALIEAGRPTARAARQLGNARSTLYQVIAERLRRDSRSLAVQSVGALEDDPNASLGSAHKRSRLSESPPYLVRWLRGVCPSIRPGAVHERAG